MKKSFIITINSLVILSIITIITFIYIQNKKLKDRKTVTLIISELDNPFFQNIKKGFQETAKKNNLNLYISNSEDSLEKEKLNVENAITNNCDILCIIPVNTKLSDKSIKIATLNNIPVITIDRLSHYENVSSHIGTDNIVSSMLAGSYIFEKLNGIGTVLELRGIKSTNVTRDREKGFETSLLQTKVKIAAIENADFDEKVAYKKVKDILNKTPNIDAIFAHNDLMALGAMKAVEEMNKNIIIVGFDGTDRIMDAIKNGKITATIIQNPELIGRIAVETSIELLEGKEIKKLINVPFKLIEYEN